MQSNDPTYEAFAAMASHIVELQARCDALSTVLLAISENLGLNTSHVRDLKKRAYATALQLRHQKVEDQNPELSAKIDRRADADDVDQILLDSLHFDSDS